MERPNELFLTSGCSHGSPEKRFHELRHAIAKRAYDLFTSRNFMHGHDLRDWLRAEAELVRPISIELSETETDLTVKASLPRFGQNDIDVRVEPRRLFIAGEREGKSEQTQSDKTRILYSEWNANRIVRTIDLPTEVDRYGDHHQRSTSGHNAQEGNKQEGQDRSDGSLTPITKQASQAETVSPFEEV